MRSFRGSLPRGLAALTVAALAAWGSGGGAGDGDARGAGAEPAPLSRVEAFRAGATGGTGSGLLIRLARLDGARGAGTAGALLHAELELPGADSRIHLVEHLAGDGSRSLVLRERTGRTVRSLRLERPASGLTEAIVHGEGATQRLELALPAGAQGPLERIEAERQGTATAGPRPAVDPFTGRARSLTSHLVWLRTGAGAPVLRLWLDRDGSGAVQGARVFVGTRLVAWRPGAGRQLAPGLPLHLDAELRDARPTSF